VAKFWLTCKGCVGFRKVSNDVGRIGDELILKRAGSSWSEMEPQTHLRTMANTGLPKVQSECGRVVRQSEGPDLSRQIVLTLDNIVNSATHSSNIHVGYSSSFCKIECGPGVTGTLLCRCFHPIAMATNGSGFAVFISLLCPRSYSSHRYAEGYIGFFKHARSIKLAHAQARLQGQVLFRHRWQR